MTDTLVHIRCDRCGGSNLHTLEEVLAGLSPDVRQLLTCALAGNHPDALSHLRDPVIRSLARADTSSVVAQEHNRRAGQARFNAR